LAVANQCPYFEIADLIIGETTCDGKKKMFELIRDKKPMLTLELPQMPDEDEALRYWEHSVRKLRVFLEESFGAPITDEAIEEAIRDGNQRRRLLLEILGYARHKPPLINWTEIKEVSDLAGSFTGESILRLMREILKKLEERRLAGVGVKDADAPRVMVTGCPIGGDAEKVFQVIEESGGVVVIQEACSGIKPIWTMIDEGTPDPIAAIASRYFALPCSCMTPNSRRLNYIDELIEAYQPDAVIDVILNCCHTYNIESHVIKEHVTEKHGLPFLKIETDYSEGDIGQLQTRIGALLELARC
jgi:benzoyl-CoA reductase/2-hydroxyglutaryl-CoA dehydratase subunit BcrC/BadD/HgdB